MKKLHTYTDLIKISYNNNLTKSTIPRSKSFSRIQAPNQKFHYVEIFNVEKLKFASKFKSLKIKQIVSVQ